jgi:alpha-galactosidase
MMGKMGYDIVVSKLDEKELQFSQEALKTYDRLKPVIWQGDQYRLASPYEGDIASLMYVNSNKDKAVWFSYLVSSRYGAGSKGTIKLAGLDPTKTYSVRELNVYPGTKSSINANATATYSGNYLMTIGFNPNVDVRRASVVLEVTEAK